MKVTFARNLKELDELSVAWERLALQLDNVLPFQTFSWNRAWWQVFKVNKLFRCDELMVTAYWDDDLLVAVIPRVVTQYRLGGINLYHYIRPIGADPNLTEIRVPLMLPHFQEQVIEHWLGTVENFADPHSLHKIIVPIQPSEAQASAMREQSVLDSMLMVTSSISRLAMLDSREISNFVVDTAESWETFRKGLKRNIKESLRHCYNSLAKDKLTAELLVLSEPAEIQSRLDAFCEMHGERAKLQGSVKHPDYFANPQHRRFLNLLADQAKGVGMKLFCLVVNGQIVAMRMGFVVNTELYMYYSGYLQSFAKYSVMTTLVSEMIAWAHVQGLGRINFSIGKDVSKTRWSPQEMVYAERHFVRDAVAAKLVGRFMLWLKTGRQPV